MSFSCGGGTPVDPEPYTPFRSEVTDFGGGVTGAFALISHAQNPPGAGAEPGHSHAIAFTFARYCIRLLYRVSSSSSGPWILHFEPSLGAIAFTFARYRGHSKLKTHAACRKVLCS